MNTALSDKFLDQYYDPTDRVAYHIGLLSSLIRNRAYSQALYLLKEAYIPTYKFYLDLKTKGWTRPDALAQTLRDLKFLRDGMNKIGMF